MKNFALQDRYTDILTLIDRIDPLAYAKTRNYADGAVSYLSPYISRGVVSLPFIKEKILHRYTKQQAYTFIFELAWREYFQRQWHSLGNAIHSDIKQTQQRVAHREIPVAVMNAATGIKAVDDAIMMLHDKGYMHNHLRMYTAAITCNMAQAHWLQPARWMYYHLADHDIASNSLSWQWVAGTFSSKKYLCDQNNINKYCHTQQQNTFLDVPYERLANMDIPEILRAHSLPVLTTALPEKVTPVLDPAKPLLIYNAYNLDPLWRKDMDANRVLLLEPSHYSRFPVSDKVLSFILSLSKNIEGIQIYSGEVEELIADNKFPAVYSLGHPAFTHYPGIKDEQYLMFPEVKTIKGSFMSYWKQCEKYL